MGAERPVVSVREGCAAFLLQRGISAISGGNWRARQGLNLRPSANHEVRCFSDGHRRMSVPISSTNTIALQKLPGHRRTPRASASDSDETPDCSPPPAYRTFSAFVTSVLKPDFLVTAFAMASGSVFVGS